MADIEAEAADVEQPKPRPRPKPKAKAGGGAGTAVASVIALAAIAMCVFLFMQVNSLKQLLGDAGIPQPAGVAGAEGHGEENGEQDDSPGVRGDLLKRYYTLGKFNANTADGKYAVIEATLELTSWYSRADEARYEMDKKIFEGEWNRYLEDLTEYNEKKKKELHGLAPGEQQYVRAGFALAVHTAPVEETPPEPPAAIPEPRTMFETLLDERTPFLRDHIITLINSHNAADIVSVDGKAAFKQNIIDSLNAEFLEDDVGKITNVLFIECIAT